MAYTDIDKPTDYFVSNLHTGNGGTLNITSLDFQPDWVWVKETNNAKDHALYDSVRGANKLLESNKTGAEATTSAGISSFNSDGWTTGNFFQTNDNGDSYVSWNWKAGTSFTNDASSTSVGSIDSAGSASDTAGFSICTHTGTGSLGTIKHGLSTKPSVILTKERSEARDWIMYHHKNTSAPATDFLLLNTADATVDNDNFMNDTEPTSSVFTVKGFSEVNKASQTYVSYIFSERKGYSKFGTYLGNSSTNGTFVYTGFKPAWIMVKKTNSANDEWNIFDNKRDPFNVMTKRLVANVTAADAAGTYVDFVSNGFKWRINNNLGNGDGNTYIYMAFAENPFVTSTGVPATAR